MLFPNLPATYAVAILFAFIVGHWLSAIFCQTFFLHRYGAHKMFTMSKGWERFFHLFTYVAQGASYLHPRGYAILHRQHHAYSDSEKDPHSPLNYTNVASMMLDTKKRYDDYAYYRVEPEAKFDGDVPEWPSLDKFSQTWVSRVGWGAIYSLFYIAVAPSPWWYLLLPIHFVIGPIQGAIVNWCGHKYGYQNFENGDASRNTLPFDFVTGGELFQNNHHKFGMSPNFAARKWEIDPTYPVIRLLAGLGILEINTSQRAHYPLDRTAEAVG